MSTALTIDVDTDALELKFRTFFAAPQVEKLMDTVGFMVEQQTKRRIHETKADPDGILWPAWSDKYAHAVEQAQEQAEAKRNKGRKASGPHHSMLEDTGALYDSITHVTHGDYVEVGSNLAYAATQFWGDDQRGIPARQALGLGDDDRREINELVSTFLGELL